MAVHYEWDAELVEGDDIIDHNHGDTYAAVRMQVARERASLGAGQRFAIVLIRDSNSGRAWAYMEGDTLPAYFEDAYGREVARVPQRFHAEVAKFHA